MKYFLRSWTDYDAGIDREISQALYPEYREEPRHPAWFPAQQLGAPRETSSAMSSWSPTRTSVWPMPRYGSSGPGDIGLTWRSAQSGNGKASPLSSWPR
jgi:hypothetical protein